MDRAAIEWVTDRVLQALTRDEPIPPSALAFLLRRYAASGRADVGDALGAALARALDEASAAGDPRGRAQWLSLFVEAAALSEDERLRTEAAALATALRQAWPAHDGLQPAMHSVAACLYAASALPDFVKPRDIVPAAIDELERVVRDVYRPGEGIAGGGLLDHAAMASALLAAFAITGRLPYSMLAEELMQFAARNLEPGAERSDFFVATCEAARVRCRLARLHRDEDYRQVAVIAVDCDYAADAERALRSLAPIYCDYGVDAAVYGLALLDLQALAS